LRQLGDQEFDITASVKNMTKYAEMVTDANDILYHLEKAYYLALNGRKGPVWLDVPINVQSAIIETDELKGFDATEESAPEITKETISFIWEKIKASKRPLIFAGTAVRYAGGLEKFQKLLDVTGIPCVTAWSGNDVIYDEHPCYAGRPGTVGNRIGNFALQNADLLIVIGCRLNIRLISYNYENFAKNAYKIMCDIDKAELEKPTISIDCKVHGDLNDFIDGLLAQAEKVERPVWTDYIAKLKTLFPAALPEYYEQEKVNAYCFIDRFTKALPEHAPVVCSNGSACVVTFQAANIKRGQRYFTNSGCAAMGYGLPASIGACIANGKNTTYCVEGDGSLQMNIQELQTIVQNKLPVKLIVLNNEGYHSIRQTQNNFFGKPLVGVGPDSSDLSFPDLSKIAAAYGFPFIRIENMAEMDDAISRFLAQDGYAVLEVMINDFPFTPKLSARKLPDGSMVSPTLEDMFPFIDRDLYRELMFEDNHEND
jgi:acetolactate synthase-1/2/3 large subunit